MSRVFSILAIVVACAALLPVGGCGPFWVNPFITVEHSNLNWMEIHYYNTLHEPTRRVSVYLQGNGHIEVKKGTSSLVSNDFAKSYDDADWGNIRTSRIDIDSRHVHDIFQDLVNRGVLDREKWFKGEKKKKEYKRFIAVKANINNRTYSEQDNIFEVDPDLAEYLLDTVRQFENPAHR